MSALPAASFVTALSISVGKQSHMDFLILFNSVSKIKSPALGGSLQSTRHPIGGHGSLEEQGEMDLTIVMAALWSPRGSS